jgi:bacterioferritin-associated ferredoxin
MKCLGAETHEMYVCLCNGHRSQDIERTARAENLTCARAIYDALGGPVCCGACVATAQQLVDDVHADRNASAYLSPCGLPQPIATKKASRPARRLMAAE